jgi:predicted RNA-binding Zn ribbon-like protein
MNAAQLDLRGGHPVIDFVNTVAWRGDAQRRIDYLDCWPDLVAWCRHAGLITAFESRRLMEQANADEAAARRALFDAKRLRESLHTLFTTKSGAEAIGEAYLAALRNRKLAVRGDVLTWVEAELNLRTAGHRIAIQAVELLTPTPLSRIKRCNDDACGWLFLDTSHRQNRRWCSAADCGNRDRARRHYERSRR